MKLSDMITGAGRAPDSSASTAPVNGADAPPATPLQQSPLQAEAGAQAKDAPRRRQGAQHWGLALQQQSDDLAGIAAALHVKLQPLLAKGTPPVAKKPAEDLQESEHVATLIAAGGQNANTRALLEWIVENLRV